MRAESSTTYAPASKTLEIREICTTLIGTKIRSGFHLELEMTPLEYEDSFRDAVEELVNDGRDFQGTVLGLVEERIPFVRQLELLGIVLDPGIFYGVAYKPEKKPYAVWLEVFGSGEGPFSGSTNYQEAVERLPNGLRPATPFEGINTDFASVLNKNFVSLPGGEYKMPGILTGGLMRFDTLCLDKYLGRPRISHLRLDELDYLVGMLAAYE
ncbi:MAG: hypothetical protein Q7R77_02825 [Candidatus Daviesbacteria bacterium]|nr:hypothetical protein [Candidatus Daviesbacteria bacterium]